MCSESWVSYILFYDCWYYWACVGLLWMCIREKGLVLIKTDFWQLFQNKHSQGASVSFSDNSVEEPLCVWFLQRLCLEYKEWIAVTFCCTPKSFCWQLLCKYNSWNIGYSDCEQYNMKGFRNKFCWQAAVPTASGTMGWTANKQKKE